ncbi:hypothetical protein DFQ30_007117 [Apophysomyces sp. BC1015]|nr:hypothetical protein DFQ30_007117 [Apophysomyces sp. BC1015]
MDESSLPDVSPRIRPFTYYVDRKEVDTRSTESTVIPWNDHSSLPSTPISALSPPPRHVVPKKGRLRSESDAVQDDDGQSGLRQRVPITRPFALRLSLDVDQHSGVSHSPSTLSAESNDTKRDEEDGISIRTALTIRRFSCDQEPFRSGVLEMKPQQEQPRHPITTAAGKSTPLLTPGSSSLTGSPTSSSPHPSLSFSLSEPGECNRPSLIERRRRRSPQTIPDDDRLTLALQNSSKWSSDDESRDNTSALSSQTSEKLAVVDKEMAWCQRRLEQSLEASFKTKSRQRAMMALEGKMKTVTMNPIADIFELDDKLESYEVDVVRDKAQYDAVVARTLHRRPCSHDEYRQIVRPTSIKQNNDGTSQLHIICEDTQESRSPVEPERLDRNLLCPTPPSSAQHPMLKIRTPSLVFFPSSPSSMGSLGDNEA